MTKEIKTFTTVEVAKKLGVNERTVRKMLCNGKLTGRKYGKKWTITHGDIMFFITKPENKKYKEYYLH